MQLNNQLYQMKLEMTSLQNQIDAQPSPSRSVMSSKISRMDASPKPAPKTQSQNKPANGGKVNDTKNSYDENDDMEDLS